ncbi:hypothetical protein VTL71DRAFT_2285 [Oculimacula yallundae]|uniref:Beta-lactamase-like ARB-00930-like C-terminal domain-containing protein n=1 Tax=Oculimacula yallundae TaxID=86028 RepID=A0ABR4CAF5_9HELO
MESLQIAFDSATKSGNSSHGPISANKTSFSIGLFSTESSSSLNPFLCQYNYAAPFQLPNKSGNSEIDENKVYRIGAVTQLFTKYTFLIEAGESHWGDLVTRLVPELAEAAKAFSANDEPLKTTGSSFDAMLNANVIHTLKLHHTRPSIPPYNRTGVLSENLTASGWDTAHAEKFDPQTQFSLLNHSSLVNKPFLTPNLMNSQRRPWQIYSAVTDGHVPITEIFTLSGSIGLYRSYVGIVPNYAVGPVILATDSSKSVDLNAYAYLVLEFLPTLEITAISQANETYAGRYTDRSSNSTISVEVEGKLGMSVTQLTNNDTDLEAEIARLKGIRSEALNFRLYPTNLHKNGRLAFRVVWQDNDELTDAATMTCVS